MPVPGEYEGDGEDGEAGGEPLRVSRLSLLYRGITNYLSANANKDKQMNVLYAKRPMHITTFSHLPL